MVWHLIEQQMNFLRFGIEYGRTDCQTYSSKLPYDLSIVDWKLGYKNRHPHKTILVSQQALNYNIHFCVFKADFLCRHYKNKSRWKEVGEEERNSTKVGKQMGVLTFCPKHTLFMNSNFFICINQSLIYYYIFLFWSEHTLEIWLHIAT